MLLQLEELADVPADDGWLDDEERATLARLHVPKRRADWRLGRWTAKRALARFAGDPGPWGIRADPDGAPRALLRGAPAPLVVSISHGGRRGAAAVAPGGTALGCDVEVIEERSAELVDQFFTERERARVAATGAGERATLVTLIWSVKESALKALRQGLRADTRSVDVELEAPAPDGLLVARAVVAGGPVLHGHARLLEGAVLTYVAEPPVGPIIGEGCLEAVRARRSKPVLE